MGSGFCGRGCCEGEVFHTLARAHFAFFRTHFYAIWNVRSDSVLAFWNAPVDSSDHELKACMCALEISRVVSERLPAILEREGIYESVRVRIGVHTGLVQVGSVGRFVLQ